MTTANMSNKTTIAIKGTTMKTNTRSNPRQRTLLTQERKLNPMFNSTLTRLLHLSSWAGVLHGIGRASGVVPGSRDKWERVDMKIIRHLSRALVLLTAWCVPLMGASAVSAAITIATVSVGNVGNAADTTGFGEVDYAYNIGEYDVTSSQYTAFLNAVAATDTYGVYNSFMAGIYSGNPGIVQSGSSGSYTYSVAAGRGNYPVTDVTFWDATRFANWLDNGQPTRAEGAGTTETGTYTLTSTAIADNTVTRNPGATWAVTSENEWYKAAYYTPLGGTGNSNPNYWLYPTQSNTISTLQANYDDAVLDTTPVGSYAYPSYYGTYDQGGDAYQWNESIYGSNRGQRGGSFDTLDFDLQPGGNNNDYLTDVGADFGFRVSQVPEPASVGILALGLSGMLLRRRGVRK
jgi:formylglycine-generating enzyme required for sulfatase activity